VEVDCANKNICAPCRGCRARRGGRRLLSQMARSALAGGLALAGYVPWPARKQIAQQDLLKLRSGDEERSASEGRKLLGRLLERTKAEYDRRAAAGQPPPVIDILIHLGWGRLGGAFGAGFLKG
jgi:hypothetical protein